MRVEVTFSLIKSCREDKSDDHYSESATLLLYSLLVRKFLYVLKQCQSIGAIRKPKHGVEGLLDLHQNISDASL